MPEPVPVRLHVERHGAGDAVVLSHGAGGSVATWSAQIADLSQRWSVTAWDLRGHGRSERPDDPGAYTRDAALDDLGGVVAGAAGGQPAVLVGHSLGGYLSFALAILHPELVRGIVAVATGPGFRDEDARRRWNDGLAATGESLGVPARVAALAAQPDSLVIDRIDEVKVPVLAVVGSRDRRFLDAAAYFERKLGARLLTVEGAGHHVHETHADTVNAAIRDFIDGL